MPKELPAYQPRRRFSAILRWKDLVGSFPGKGTSIGVGNRPDQILKEGAVAEFDEGVDRHPRMQLLHANAGRQRGIQAQHGSVIGLARRRIGQAVGRDMGNRR